MPLDHPDAALLVGRLNAYYEVVYGGGDATPMDTAEFAPPRGRFVVGYRDGRPVTCGGWRARDTDIPMDGIGSALRPGDAELKRLYVDPAHRGRGIARLVVAHLEEMAAAAGRLRMVLETGDRQPAAEALYLGAGYAPIERFGRYRREPACRCFARTLPRPSSGMV